MERRSVDGHCLRTGRTVIAVDEETHPFAICIEGSIFNAN